MKIKLGENIQALRKARGLTQEQLAEAMGVTVGAVSKWENSQSNPELQLIPELAEFFDTSVDVLLGYAWEERGMGEAARRIKELTGEKRYDEARREAAKALEKYPNSFQVVYQSARLYSLYGLEHGDKPAIRQAQELFRRGLALMAQNTDPQITPLTLQINIGECYTYLQAYDKALEHLKRYNDRGINNTEIGICLTKLKRYDEAMTHLSESLLGAIANLSNIIIALVNILANTKDRQEAQALLDWALEAAQGLLLPGRVGKLHKMLAGLWGMKAVIYADGGQQPECDRCFRQALIYARLFDAAHNDRFEIRFYHGKPAVSYDDGGVTAMLMLERLAKEQEAPAAWGRLEAIIKEEEAHEA